VVDRTGWAGAGGEEEEGEEGERGDGGGVEEEPPRRAERYDDVDALAQDRSSLIRCA
jgi:hypothetical protein